MIVHQSRLLLFRALNNDYEILNGIACSFLTQTQIIRNRSGSWMDDENDFDVNCSVMIVAKNDDIRYDEFTSLIIPITFCFAVFVRAITRTQP